VFLVFKFRRFLIIILEILAIFAILCQEIIFYFKYNRTKPTKESLFYRTEVIEIIIIKELGKLIL